MQHAADAPRKNRALWFTWFLLFRRHHAKTATRMRAFVILNRVVILKRRKFSIRLYFFLSSVYVVCLLHRFEKFLLFFAGWAFRLIPLKFNEDVIKGLKDIAESQCQIYCA